MSKVDVIVATRNRYHSLALMLQSLREQKFQNWDLVIIDESDDDILKYKSVHDLITRIKFEGHRVKLLKNKNRKGIWYARNLSTKHAEHELVCRIDDDSIVHPDYLLKLYKLIKGKKNVAGAGGIVPPFGHHKSIRKIEKVSPVFNKIHFKKDRVVVSDDGGYFYSPNDILPSDHLRSSFMYRKSAWDDVGGYVKCGGVIGWREETCFTMKLKWNGYDLLTDTSAICWHAHATSGGARLPQKVYKKKQVLNEDWFQRWALRQYKKHGDKYG